MVYLTLVAVLLLVLWPILLPLAIHGSHTIANSRRRARVTRTTGSQPVLANHHGAPRFT